MTTTIAEKTQATIAAELRRTFRHLFAVEGCSVVDILVVIHAETIAEIGGCYGRQAAADCAEAALRRLDQMPAIPFRATETANKRGMMQ